jgi:glycosyltransferase domain-containing protein
MENLNNRILDKITIIIFAYDRQEELKKKIIYYGEKYKLIILDRSLKSISDFCKIYLNKKSRYFHYPKKSYFDRFLLLKKLLKTKYVMLQTDDDFFLEENIKKSLIFLEKNKKFSSVGGKAYTCSTYYNKIYLKNIFTNIKSINNDNYNLRIQSLCKGTYGSLYYGVIRKSIFLKNITILKKNLFFYKDEMYGLHDLQLLLCLTIAGKIKIFNEIFYLRNKESPRRPWPSSHSYMMVDIYSKFKNHHLNFFINTILSFLKKNSPYNQFLIKKNLEYYFFSRKNQSEKKKSFKTSFITYFFNRFMPAVFKKFIKFMFGWHGEIFNKNWYLKSRIKFDYKNYVSVKQSKEYFGI